MVLLLSLLLPLAIAFGNSYYCIQVVSSKSLQPLKERFSSLSHLPYSRIEKVGGFYTIRIGFFKSPEEAEELYRKVKGLFRDAMLRKCRYAPERIVYENSPAVKNELYKLLVSALLGSSKLDQAVAVARRGTELFPRDPYWWELYAKLLEWSGKPRESLNPLLRAYELSGDRRLLRKAFRLALATGRYDLARRLLDKVEVTHKERLFVYSKTGDLEGLKEYLRSEGSKESLKTLAELLLSLGKHEEALETIERIEKTYGSDEETLLLKAKVLFAKRQFKKALDTLRAHMKEADRSAVEFWRTLATLSWMLADYDTSLRASLVLIESGQGQPADYERVISILNVKEPRRAIKMSLSAWKAYGSERFVHRAVQIAYTHGYWKELIDVVEGYPHKEKLLEEEFTFIAYATALYRLGMKKKALALFDRRLRDRFSRDLLYTYIFLLIDAKEHNRLRAVLKAYDRNRSYPQLSEAFIYGYLALNMGGEAYRLYKSAGIEDPIMLADVFDVMGKKRRAFYIRFREFRKMRAKLKRRTTLLKSAEFTKDYLYLSLHFLSAPAYEKLLMSLRGYLDDTLWRELYLSYLLSEGSYDKVRYLARMKLYRLEPWMELSLYLRENDVDSAYAVYQELPSAAGLSDTAETLLRAGKPGLALKLSYEWLHNNPYDVSSYVYLRDISVGYAGKFNATFSLLSRKGYSELRTSSGVNLRFNSLTTKAVLTYKRPLSKDADLIKKTPEGTSFQLTSSISLGKATAGVGFGLFRRDGEVLTSGVFGELKPFSELKISLSLFRNKETEETLYLYIGGVKDSLQFNSELTLSKRLFLFGEFDYSRFYTLNREDLGTGNVVTTQLTYKLRTLYPDYSFRMYSQVGRFTSSGYAGDMDGVVPSPGFQIIPEDYESFGVGFFFGYENRDSYVRVWRPFVDLELGYNTRYGLLSSATAGLGGSLIDKDNVYLYMSLSDNRGPTQETVFRLGMSYNRWF
ncbi:tetratricopeptide repeat protein [Hydrogenivirga sp. 128-5-R1-1]|uniref:tetratricopeptide repeat protein n=1 Tax=Hydrogenivirga sp. 128-5-R1-1 TaxID=392423 RepID=UPI00015F17B9|nr:tetratricopeptide repeat protein [Hydrogenivirga sp. 128-5-R1-1]EDP76227.1 hypothetical protein HG1285_18694 [Hydrogenivirga sp. 128-5-R1-1]